MTMSRNQLKAARMLLGLSQEELALMSEVGVVTVRRYETGHKVGPAVLDRLQESVEAAGVILIGGGTIGGHEVGDGVALRPKAKLPPDTKAKVDFRNTPNVSETPRRPGRPEKAKPGARRAEPDPTRSIT